MKKSLQILTVVILVASAAFLPWLGSHQNANASFSPAGNGQTPTERPLLYIVEYHTDYGGNLVSPWYKFGLTFTLGNNGKVHARNIVLTFESAVFDSLDGGVFTVYEVVAENQGNENTHHFKVNDMSTWLYSGTITAHATYNDPDGNAYSDTFTFTLSIDQPATGGGSATQTPTPAALSRPQIVVSAYNIDLETLQPGNNFELRLRVENVGSAEARSVSLVYGGGTSAGLDPEGTPQAGGLSGTGGDFTNFAPLGKSNVVLLGNLAVGASQETQQEFVVNVSTVPGAYPLKLSFVYTDAKGQRLVDDQVITLLVYSLPQLEVSFYRTPDLVNAGMMTSLPLQIVNLGRKSVVLGNVTVSAPNAELQNNTVLVGTLDPGGYFSFDPTFMAFEEGNLELNFEIKYTDDFNQLRVYNATLPLEVMPAMEFPTPEVPLDENGNPIEGGGIETPTEELSIWQKIWNAVRGFFGFGVETPTEVPLEVPTQEPIPVVPGGKG